MVYQLSAKIFHQAITPDFFYRFKTSIFFGISKFNFFLLIAAKTFHVENPRRYTNTSSSSSSSTTSHDLLLF